MRKMLLSLLLASGLLVVPVGLAPHAAAEPMVQRWICANAWEWDTISRYDFFGCPMGDILVIDGYSGKKVMLIGGLCANQLHMRNPKATWQTAVQKCLIRRFNGL